MALNKRLSKDKIKLIDSIPLPVCRNKRIFHNRSAKLANRGKSSMGWFYGFKLHLIVDQDGFLLSLKITPGNISDQNHDLVLSLTKDIRGMLVGDTGYESKELQYKLGNLGLTLITGFNKRTKKLVTLAYESLRRLRQKIESINGQIKYRKSCVSSVPRSDNGYWWRYMNAVAAYVFTKQFI